MSKNTSTPTTPNLNILLLKEDERFHKSEEKKKKNQTKNPTNAKHDQNIVSRAFTSSSLSSSAVNLGLCANKPYVSIHSGVDQKTKSLIAENERLGQGQRGSWLKPQDIYS